MRRKRTDIEMLFLGSGNAFAPGRAFSSFLLDRRILFEATPTTLPALRELGIPLEDIQTLFVSHFHGDHCFGLPFLFLDHYFITKRKRPLTIIGPKGIERLSNDLVDLAFPNTRRDYHKNFPVEFLEVTPGKEYRTGDITFKSLSMFHGDAPALGFSLEYKDRRLAYGGDTGRCPALDRLLNGADIAILEMSSLYGDLSSHLNMKDVLEIRKRLSHDTRLVLTHLPALTFEQKEALLHNPYGVLELAEDMQCLRFGL